MANEPMVAAPDRDQQLLECLAILERLGQRDQAIRELAVYLGEAFRHSGKQVAIPTPLPVLSPGIATVAGEAVPPPLPLPQQVHEHVTTPVHAEHPLASHILTLLPLEWQVSLQPILQRANISLRTLVFLLVLCLCAGIYTGHVTVPGWIREQLQQCQKVQP